MKGRREIERKYIVPGKTLYGAELELRRHFRETDAVIKSGGREDVYWRIPGADFFRLRAEPAELTFKRTDQGDISNRQEENLPIIGHEAARTFFSDLLGEPACVVDKRFVEFYLPDGCVVSLAQVRHDPEERLILEVEGPSEHRVARVACSLPFEGLYREQRSVFQMFVGRGLGVKK